MRHSKLPPGYIFLLVIIPMVVISYFPMASLVDRRGGNETPSWSAFPPASADDTNPSTLSLALWMENTPSMYGFVEKEMRENECIPHAYINLYQGLQRDFHIEGKTLDRKSYFFNQRQVSDMSSTAALRKKENYITEESSETGKESASALAMALSSLSHADAAILFTDLEGDPEDAIPQVAELFQKQREDGKAIVIQRFLSSFGGILYDYGGGTRDYHYGDKKGIKIDGDGKYLHRMPRPFYAITIAPADTCALIQQFLSERYDSFCKEAEKEVYCDTDHSMSKFYSQDVMVYSVESSSEILRRISLPGQENEPIQLGNLSGATLAEAQPWADATQDQDNGVYEFVINKDSTEQYAFIPFSFVPAIASLDPLPACQALDPTLQVEVSGWEDAELEASEEILVAPKPTDFFFGRGFWGRRQTKTIYTKTSGIFTCIVDTASQDFIQASLRVHIRNAEEGLYRATITFRLAPHAEEREKNFVAHNPDWSISAADAKAALQNQPVKKNPFLRTIAIDSLLERLDTDQIAFWKSEDAQFDVATIVLDLRIQGNGGNPQ